MQVLAKQGDTIADVIYRHLGVDSDDVESIVYQLNPSLRAGDLGLVMGQVVVLPDALPSKPVEGVPRVWD